MATVENIGNEPVPGVVPVRLELRVGLLWGVGLAAIGAVILMLEPFVVVPTGTKQVPEGAILNALALGCAPGIGLWRAYRPVSRHEFEPRGLNSRRRLSGRLLDLIMGSSGAFAAIGIAGGDSYAGLLAAGLILGSSVAFLEAGRRTRAPLARAAWTDQQLDQLTPDIAPLPVGALWVAAFVVAAVAGGDDRLAWVQWAVGGAAVSALLVYRGAVFAPGAWRSPALVGVALYGLSVVVAVLAYPTMAGVVYLVLATPFAVIAARRGQQRLIESRRAALVAHGHAADLVARYGRAAGVEPEEVASLPEPDALAQPIDAEEGAGEVQVLSRTGLLGPVSAVFAWFWIVQALPVLLVALPVLAIVVAAAWLVGMATCAGAVVYIVRRFPRIGLRFTPRSGQLHYAGGMTDRGGRDPEFGIRAVGPARWITVSSGQGTARVVPGTLHLRGGGPVALRWRTIGARSGWTQVAWDRDPGSLSALLTSAEEVAVARAEPSA